MPLQESGFSGGEQVEQDDGVCASVAGESCQSVVAGKIKRPLDDAKEQKRNAKTSGKRLGTFAFLSSASADDRLIHISLMCSYVRFKWIGFLANYQPSPVAESRQWVEIIHLNVEKMKKEELMLAWLKISPGFFEMFPDSLTQFNRLWLEKQSPGWFRR